MLDAPNSDSMNPWFAKYILQLLCFCKIIGFVLFNILKIAMDFHFYFLVHDSSRAGTMIHDVVAYTAQNSATKSNIIYVNMAG